MQWLCRIGLSLCCSIVQAVPVCCKAFVEKPEQGWLWYREQQFFKSEPLKQETAKQLIRQNLKQQLKPPKTNAERIELMRKEFAETLATALLQPTLSNVTQVKQKQLEFEARSTEFAKMWSLSHLLQSSGYSHNGNPHPWHQAIAQKQRAERLTEQLKQLAKTYGLFFAFKQSCPYCHRFAPVVARFAESYGFELQGIAADGGVMAGIAKVVRDNGALALINPQGVYPALFLANPSTMQVIPVAWGMVTQEQLLQNLELLLPQLVAA
ncbi:MAG: conjugal transfer protein TraF [Pseudomonadota bacterium]